MSGSPSPGGPSFQQPQVAVPAEPSFPEGLVLAPGVTAQGFTKTRVHAERTALEILQGVFDGELKSEDILALDPRLKFCLDQAILTEPVTTRYTEFGKAVDSAMRLFREVRSVEDQDGLLFGLAVAERFLRIREESKSAHIDGDRLCDLVYQQWPVPFRSNKPSLPRAFLCAATAFLDGYGWDIILPQAMLKYGDEKEVLIALDRIEMDLAEGRQSYQTNVIHYYRSSLEVLRGRVKAAPLEFPGVDLEVLSRFQKKFTLLEESLRSEK